MTRVLLIGYGNPGRRDDGLGPLAVGEIEKLNLPDVSVEEAYQLQVELAEPISEHDVVLFVDASVSGREPFELRDVEPSLDFEFSTHAMSPEGLLGVAHTYGGSAARGLVLAIRGYEFDTFGEELSPRGEQNLGHAVAFLKKALVEPDLRTLLAGQRTGPRGVTT